jgi:DnaJ-class molecular chaperone
MHADKNKEAGAEDTFKKISEAYNVLADVNARRTYDADIRLGVFG